MNENEKKVDSSTPPRFAVQFGEYVPTTGQEFHDPSMTIPDQSMTIPEIIAKFTRTGLVPASVNHRDDGGNVAADPESDPLDDFFTAQAAAAAARAAGAERAAGPAGGAENEIPIGGAGETGGASETGGA